MFGSTVISDMFHDLSNVRTFLFVYTEEITENLPFLPVYTSEKKKDIDIDKNAKKKRFFFNILFSFFRYTVVSHYYDTAEIRKKVSLYPDYRNSQYKFLMLCSSWILIWYHNNRLL